MPVALLDKNLKIIKVFENATFVEKEIEGTDRNHVNAVCKGIYHTHVGFKFKRITREQFYQLQE